MPEAVRTGNWWRRRWHFTLRPGHDLVPILLPPPIDGITGLSMLVTAQWASDNELIVETFTAGEDYTGDELTYLSVVAAWLQSRTAVSVEGDPGHPLLRMSHVPPETLAWIESLNDR